MVTNFQMGRAYGVGHIHPSVVTLKAVGMSADNVFVVGVGNYGA